MVLSCHLCSPPGIASGRIHENQCMRRGGVAERRCVALGRGNSVIARSPRTEAYVAGVRKRHYVRFGPRPHALIESGHEGWNFLYEGHISCPTRTPSPRAPPREPSPPCGWQTTYPALDAARWRKLRRDFWWIWEADDEGQLRCWAASLKGQHNLPYADCFAAAGGAGRPPGWKSSKPDCTASWPTCAGRRVGGTGCAPPTCPSADGFFRHLCVRTTNLSVG